jgi:cellulose biosynthesis protein BcsQ
MGRAMISVCFFNNKGGVGKTTLTCNVAAHFALKFGKRVLVVDCDPQCNATQLILDEDLTSKLYRRKETSGKTGTILDVLRPLQVGEASIDTSTEPMKANHNRFGVDILPGHPRLSILEDVLSQAWSEGSSGKIGGIRRSNWCAALTSHLDSEYDLAFFDIGPSLGSLNRSVLLGVRYFVSPVGADLFSIFGIRNISDWLAQWLKVYEVGLGLAEDQSQGLLAEYGIALEPLIKRGFAGYTVQQYITKSKEGVRRPTVAYERLLKVIPEEIDDSLSRFFGKGVRGGNVHLGDVPHMYSLVPLAQSANTPICALTSADGLAGSQFKQSEKYAVNLDVIVQALAKNLKISLRK